MENVAGRRRNSKPDPSRWRTKFVSEIFNGLVKVIFALIFSPTLNVLFSILKNEIEISKKWIKFWNKFRK